MSDWVPYRSVIRADATEVASLIEEEGEFFTVMYAIQNSNFPSVADIAMEGMKTSCRY